MIPDFYEWPEAIGWLVFNCKEGASSANEALEDCRRTGRNLNLAIVHLGLVADEARQARPMPEIRPAEKALIALLLQDGIWAEGRESLSALPERIPPNAWRSAEVVPGQDTFDLRAVGGSWPMFFDVRVHGSSLRKAALAAHGRRDHRPSAVSGASVSEIEAAELYRQRTKASINDGIRFSRADDERWGRSLGLTRPTIRDLRSKFLPENRKKAGRPPS